MKIIYLLLIQLFLLTGLSGQVENKVLFRTDEGKVSFTSDAPLEIIKAESNELKGIIDPKNQTFAFQINVKSLIGFNSPLQQEHFYENYLETDKYPNASFSGKIIEKINFDEIGNYSIRAKGDLNIHGVKQERIIKCSFAVNESGFTVTSDFVVHLADHSISIPKLVYQKIAEDIKVELQADLKRTEKDQE